jgi:hypothetical protein
MAIDLQAQQSRRALLTGSVGALGALAAVALAAPARVLGITSDDGSTVVVGASYATAGTTRIYIPLRGRRATCSSMRRTGCGYCRGGGNWKRLDV